MQIIRIAVLALLFLFPFASTSQNLDCCQSISEVESTISGYWKIKESPSKTIYHYWINKGQGNVEDVVTTDIVGKYDIIERNHSFFYVAKTNDGFKLNYVYKYGNWTSKISYLDTNKLILLTNGEATEYFRHTAQNK